MLHTCVCVSQDVYGRRGCVGVFVFLGELITRNPPLHCASVFWPLKTPVISPVQ